jgi:steroid delta-isomerase-like uncharacterized protein
LPWLLHGEQRKPKRKEGSSNVEENKALVRRLMDAINNHNFDELNQLVAADVVDHNAVILMQPDGPGGVEQGTKMLLEGFPDLHIEVEELVAEGERVAARLTLSGTNTGPYRGLPAPTQQHFVSEALTILRISDGKVAEIRGTADRLGMLTQLGILPDIG